MVVRNYVDSILILTIQETKGKPAGILKKHPLLPHGDIAALFNAAHTRLPITSSYTIQISLTMKSIPKGHQTFTIRVIAISACLMLALAWPLTLAPWPHASKLGSY